MSRIYWIGLLIFLLLPGLCLAQGRQTKVQYDAAFRFGSQKLTQGNSAYFQVLTTPAPGDPNNELIRYWGPRLDRYYEDVCDNLQLSRREVCRYLLYPELFIQLEKLTLEGKLHEDWFDPLIDAALEVHDGGAPHTLDALRIDDPMSPPGTRQVRDLPRTDNRQRWDSRFIDVTSKRLLVWLPDRQAQLQQRCVLYRTLADFLATPIGPPLPEGVLGFVPRHDPSLPIVIYASLGEDKLQRTAQHEIAHAVIESIAKYNRALAVTRNRHAKRDSTKSQTWRPGSGGFSAITHENFAEYLSFPHGEMDPTLKASLVERVADNRLDGLGAISVGARTVASSYIEGPVRLYFLADQFGKEMPKRLMLGYFSNTRGFLEILEELTGHPLGTLEQLYRRWLRELLWEEHLATDIPDTVGSVIATGLSGVERQGRMLLQRARLGRQELVLITPPEGRGKPRVDVLAKEISGIEHLPLFSSPDLRDARVAASVRNRNIESLMIWNGTKKRQLRRIHEIDDVREIRDPRFSPSGERIVFRVVDSSGRNAIGSLDLVKDEARQVTDWMWEHAGHPSFAESEHLVLFNSTRTPDHTSDVFLLDINSLQVRNLTNTAAINETEPVLVNGHLACFSDESGTPLPTEYGVDGSKRTLVHMPFAVSGLAVGDSTLIMVGNSLRHHRAPAGRALWGFPFDRIGLADSIAAPTLDISQVIAQAQPSANGASIASDRQSQPLGASEASMPGNNGATAANAHNFGFSPYKQKWRFMPLGINFNGTGNFSTASSLMGFDTEFHDQAVVIGAGRSGNFDRFGMVQYRNSASRTHWQLSTFYRSVVRSRYQIDSVVPIDRNEIEAGAMFSAQYHKSLVTRIGFNISASRRTDTLGDILTLPNEIPLQTSEAPILGLQFGGLSPRTWNHSIAGLSDLSLLAEDSPTALAQWQEAERKVSASVEPRFVPAAEYARSNVTVGTSWSRDTRVWADYRGPRHGALLVFSLSAGFDAPGNNILLNSSQGDSLRQRVGAGLDRVTASWLFVAHRRLSVIDLAWRVQGLVNEGTQALTYGMGGLHSLSGISSGSIRSQRIAWTNAEARVPLWNYGRFSLRIPQLVFPAADAFAFYDAGIADGISGLHSYGVGVRLKMGFLTYEWRRQLRNGLQNQSGLTLAW